MAETKMQLVDWLDDLTVRFLLNLPPAELSSVPRLCFQVEEAQWYYEDFIRPAAAAAGAPLPSLHLRQFCLLLFQHCPLLSGFTDAQHIAAYDEFLAYKTRVPVRGAIMMDEAMEKVVLVKGWKKSASWSFPRGKINKDEKDLDCAIREVDEETGFDIKAAGLVPTDEADAKFIDVEMKGQQLRMFVFRNVPADTNFAPKTRKEISKIAWYNVRDLPGFKKSKNRADIEGSTNKFYMVAPFLPQLKKWIGQQRRQVAFVAQNQTETEDETDAYVDEKPVEPSPTLDRSSELRRLLSIGGASAISAAGPTSVPQPANQGSDLLALLQGKAPKATVPQTPLEQIHAFPQEPQSPKSHHPREPSVGTYYQPPPQFPLSPSHASPPSQQPQHIASVTSRTTSEFGPNGFSPQRNAIPAHMLHALPPNPTAMLPAAPNEVATQQRQGYWQQSHAQTFESVTPQDHPDQHISNMPSVPKASQLPPPRLNPHSLRLLDAFKGGSQSAVPPLTPSSQPVGQPHAQQAALLGLFRQPSQPALAQQGQQFHRPNDPTSPGESKKPDISLQRRPTLNEITRTLPLGQAKRKSSTSSHSTAIQTLKQPVPLESQTAETPLASEKVASPSLESPAFQTPHTLQHHSSGQKPHSTSSQQRKPASTRAAQSSIIHSKPTENGAPPAPIKILQRPSAARDTSSPVIVNLSHRGSESTKLESPKLQQTSQPQLLKRQVPAETAGTLPVSGQQAPSTGVDKTTQLLALFNKSPKRNAASGAADSSLHSSEPNAPQPQPSVSQDSLPHRTDQLGLFDAAAKTAPSTNAAGPPSNILPVLDPPSAPRLSPASKPIRQKTPENKQQQLLNLFMHKPQHFNSAMSTHTSPGTPISPFALPTPAQANSLASFLEHANANGTNVAGPRGSGAATPTPRSASAIKATGAADPHPSRSPSIASPVVQTPTEHKDFLLGYLNGVVQKEGHRGAKRP